MNQSTLPEKWPLANIDAEGFANLGQPSTARPLGQFTRYMATRQDLYDGGRAIASWKDISTDHPRR